MAQLGDTNSTTAALRLLRKSEAAMKARQYQIVAVVGTIDTDQSYQVNNFTDVQITILIAYYYIIAK